MSDQADSYAEKLRDPRWQRMRLQVFEAAGWRCQSCGDDREELHAHHDAYSVGRDPWDYPLENFRCLCGTCHGLSHMPAKKVVAFAKAALMTGESDRLWLAEFRSTAQREFEARRRALYREREEALDRMR